MIKSAMWLTVTRRRELRRDKKHDMSTRSRSQDPSTPKYASKRGLIVQKGVLQVCPKYIAVTMVRQIQVVAVRHHLRCI